MLMLWLSIVSMIPFDMIRLDSNLKDEEKKPVMVRIIEAGKVSVQCSDSYHQVVNTLLCLLLASL